MRLSVTVTKIQYDVKGIVTATFKALRGQMLIAASKFVHEAAQAVPIDTGMARGSFLNLLQLLDSNSDKPDEGVIKMGSLGDYARAIPDGIPTEAQKRDRYGHYFKYYHSDGETYNKAPKTAKKFSTSRGQIIKREGDSLVFNYEIDVVHFNYMDEFGAGWHAMRRGKDAFMNSLTQFKPPSVNKYLIMTRQTNASDSEGNPTVLRNQKTVK